jgi:hypothetical protein
VVCWPVHPRKLVRKPLTSAKDIERQIRARARRVAQLAWLEVSLNAVERNKDYASHSNSVGPDRRGRPPVVG